MSTLYSTDKIGSGGQYTFTFKSDGYLKPGVDDVVSSIYQSGLPVADVQAQYFGGISGVFGNTLKVDFKWTQTGWTVKQVASNLEGAVDKVTAGNITFLTAEGQTSVSHSLIKSALGQDSSPVNIQAGDIAWYLIAAIGIIVIGGGVLLGVSSKVGANAA